jgi:hypothetical protein
MQSIYMGSLANGYLNANSTSLESSFSNCNMTWRNPTRTILRSLTELMFLTGVSVANIDSNKNPLTGNVSLYPAELQKFNNATMHASQNLKITGTFNTTVYHSRYPFLTGAIALLLFNAFLILLTFYGCWELGRPISLNPINTAKAFNAPLLAGPGSNTPLAKLAESMGTSTDGMARRPMMCRR